MLCLHRELNFWCKINQIHRQIEKILKQNNNHNS